MKKKLHEVWHDPVWSKVIAAGFIGLFGLMPVAVAYWQGWFPAIKSWLGSPVSLPLGIVTILSLLAIMYAASVLQRIVGWTFPQKTSIRTALRNLVNETENSSILTTKLLRNAEKIAHELNDAEVKEWIKHEINGYPDWSQEKLPGYRQNHGELKAFNPYRGWETVHFRDAKTREILTYAPCGEGIDTLEMFPKKDDVQLEFVHSPKQKQTILDALEDVTDCKLLISSHSIEHVIKKVRSRIADWANEKLNILSDSKKSLSA